VSSLLLRASIASLPEETNFFPLFHAETSLNSILPACCSRFLFFYSSVVGFFSSVKFSPSFLQWKYALPPPPHRIPFPILSRRFASPPLPPAQE